MEKVFGRESYHPRHSCPFDNYTILQLHTRTCFQFPGAWGWARCPSTTQRGHGTPRVAGLVHFSSQVTFEFLLGA